MRSRALLVACTILVLFAAGCGKQAVNEVVVYTSVDQEFSKPVFEEFQKRTGVKVKPLYDVESAKGAGLTNRLLAEKPNPRCDVWWNSEFARTQVLEDAGVLQAYRSGSASDIPRAFKDPGGCWAGYAVRARVIIYNTRLVRKEDAPRSILDLADPKWKGKVGFPNPAFGTASAHCAGLFLELGEAKAIGFFRRLRDNGVVICPGNAYVRDRVVAGDLAVGVVDSDDANVAIQRHQPLAMVLPDQTGIGAFLIPNTVAMIRGCPHPEAARKLVDYLLSRKVEARLASCGYAPMPVRPGIPPPECLPALSAIRASKTDYVAVSRKMAGTSKLLTEMLVR